MSSLLRCVEPATKAGMLGIVAIQHPPSNMSKINFSQIGQLMYEGLSIDNGHLKVVYCCWHTFKPNGHKLDCSQVNDVIRKLPSPKPEDMQTMPDAFLNLQDAA